MSDRAVRYERPAGWGLLALALPAVLWLHQAPAVPGWMTTASLGAQLLAVVLAVLVFVQGCHATLAARKGAMALLGSLFLIVGAAHFLHLLAALQLDPSLRVAPAPSRYWLAARLLAASAMLMYALLPVLPLLRAALLRLLALLLLLGSLYLGGRSLQWWAPPGADGVAWLAIALYGATLLALWWRRQHLRAESVTSLAFAAALGALSESLLLGYGQQANGLALGHGYASAAYLFLLYATISESLRRPLRLLAMQHQREQVTLSAAPDGVLWVASDGTLLMANPAMETLSGYPLAQLLGANLSLLLPEPLRAAHQHTMAQFFAAPHPRAMGTVDLRLRRSDGSLLPVDISLGFWDQDGTRHAIAYIRDLSERKALEDTLRHKAFHDQLTGLPNRSLFLLQLNQGIARTQRSGLSLAVLFIDLDQFKTVNDSFGHASGDALLIQAGARIRGTLRAADLLARLGGDEFAVILGDLHGICEATTMANRLLQALQLPYQLQGQDVYSSASIGIATVPGDTEDSATLLRYADLAMYQAKQNGRGAYACYAQQLNRQVQEDMQLHTRLKEALAADRLELHYQPQAEVHSGALIGAEALLRWRDAVLGDVAPDRFVALAESSGLIIPLSDWVLERACQQLACWVAAGTPLRIAVNFSSHQFDQPNLVEKVAATLARTGAPARWLEIEITESVAMKQPERAREQIQGLVALGCRVALDDFGTGYSSLASLRDLPVHVLKIDRSFMRGIPANADDCTIARAIIGLAHSLDLDLVAEGVETAQQLAFLRQHGCGHYQGWLYGRAMPAAQLTVLLRAPLARHCAPA
ncbi:MAG: putative bifunctional diguanylate cyclase/phosphodiesterase [Sphingomonadaceae bacterium]